MLEVHRSMFRQKNVSGQPNFKILTTQMPLQALNICERTSSLCQNPLKNVMMMNKIIYSVSIMRVGQFCNHYCFKTRLFFCGWMNSSMTPPTMERNSAFTDSRLLSQKGICLVMQSKSDVMTLGDKKLELMPDDHSGVKTVTKSGDH